MKRLFSFFFAVTFIVTSSIYVNAADDISAGAYVLMCAETGEVIASRDERARLPIASLTKIMTAVIAIENLDLDAEVTVPPEACGIEGSSIYLLSGEKLTVKELLYAVLLESANDASTALAFFTSGSVDEFCVLMNKKAEELGMADSRFMNPHGLDMEGHYSSAYDLALLTRYALSLTVFKEIASSKSFKIPYNGAIDGRSLVNHNRLLGTYEGCIGVKTGYTKKCGRCLVSAAERDGVTLIAVTLRDPNDWRDHAALLDRGFSSMIKRDLVVEGEAIDVHVVSGAGDHVTCTAEPLFTVMSRDAGDVECSLQLDRFYFAPVRAGDTLGYMVFYYSGREIGRSRVYACETVERVRYKKTLFEKIYDLFR